MSVNIRPFKKNSETLRNEYCMKRYRGAVRSFWFILYFFTSLEHLPTLSYQNDLNMLPFLLTKDMYISSPCFPWETEWYLECNFKLFFCDFFSKIIIYSTDVDNCCTIVLWEDYVLSRYNFYISLFPWLIVSWVRSMYSNTIDLIFFKLLLFSCNTAL